MIEIFHQSCLILDKILDKISDYYYVSDFSEMLVENKDIFFSCLCRTLFIIYTMQLRIHNKPTLEGLKKNNFPANSTIQKKKLDLDFEVNVGGAFYSCHTDTFR